MYIHYFIAGHVLQRHGVIKGYVNGAARRPAAFRCVQAVSFASLLGLFW